MGSHTHSRTSPLSRRRRTTARRDGCSRRLTIQQEADDRSGLAASLEVFARLAVAEGLLERAARLDASASVIREEVGFDPSGPGWPDPELHAAHLRAALGDE